MNEQTRRCETAAEMWEYVETVKAQGGDGPFNIRLEMSETKHPFFFYDVVLGPPDSAAGGPLQAHVEAHPAAE